MKRKVFTTRAEADAIKVTIRQISKHDHEVWIHTATNRQCVGTFDNSHEADRAATRALIAACYDYDGPFDPEAWREVVTALYA